jgi:hypothetical protein
MSRLKTSKYHKEPMIEVTDEHGIKKEVPRRCCHIKVEKQDAKDGTPIFVASDRVYLVNKDGSMKSLKNKISKKDRRLAREEAKKHQFPLPTQSVFKPESVYE